MRLQLKNIILFLMLSSLSAMAHAAPTGIVLNLNGAIGPATQAYVFRGIDVAEKNHAALVILMLDTPGGLDKSMREIVAKIIRSPIPIVTYVAPSGARAASAGTYILYASHVAAMAPGTNVGAATPVSIGSLGGGTEKATTLSPEEKKAINDATAYLKGLAQLRNRNEAWAEKAVMTGASIPANEALALQVIDLVAVNLNDLLTKLNGKVVTVQNKSVTLMTTQINLKELSPDWRTRFLAMITDPNIAYILLLIGIYGIFFEFFNPGFILPGVVGVISLLIALYAFQLLPINYAGLALILLGIAFMVAEIFLASFGVLGVGGIIAFVLGSIMLFDRNIPGFTLLLPVIIAVTMVTVGFILFILQLAYRAYRRPVVSGREELIDSEGNVILIGDEERPRIRIRGELWQIRSDVPLRQGQRVKVVDIDELILIVVPVNETKSAEGNAV